MRTLLRTLVILAAALLVVAGLFAFRQSSYGQSFAAAGPDRGALSQEGDAPPALTTEEGSAGAASGFRGGDAERPGANLFAAVELLQNLAIIAVSVTLIALGSWMVRRGRREAAWTTPPEPL